MWPRPQFIVSHGRFQQEEVREARVACNARGDCTACRHMFLDELSSRWSVGRTPLRATASMRCRSSAVAKPHQALDVYSGLERTTDL